MSLSASASKSTGSVDGSRLIQLALSVTPSLTDREIERIKREIKAKYGCDVTDDYARDFAAFALAVLERRSDSDAGAAK